MFSKWKFYRGKSISSLEIVSIAVIFHEESTFWQNSLTQSKSHRRCCLPKEKYVKWLQFIIFTISSSFQSHFFSPERGKWFPAFKLIDQRWAKLCLFFIWMMWIDISQDLRNAPAITNVVIYIRRHFVWLNIFLNLISSKTHSFLLARLPSWREQFHFEESERQ